MIPEEKPSKTLHKTAKVKTKPLDGRQSTIVFCALCIFLGLMERTGKYIVGTAEGCAERCRDFKRRPLGERWNRDLVFNLKALPWAPSGPKTDGSAESDVLLRATKRLEAAIAPAVGRDALPPVPNVEYKSRALYVTARLLEKFGKTPGCSACEGKIGAHNDDCRARILGCVMSDPAECARYGYEPSSAAEDTSLSRPAAEADDVVASGSMAVDSGTSRQVVPELNAGGDAEMTPLPAIVSVGSAAAASSSGPSAMDDGTERDLGVEQQEGQPKTKRQNVMALEAQTFENCEFASSFVDEITGLPLGDAEVEKAMADELAEYVKHDVAEEVSIEACWAATGARPLDCRWKIINKGDAMRRDIRARLLAREMKKDKIGWETVFAGTPPLWAFRALCSSVRRGEPRDQRGARKLRITDIKRAFFHSVHSGTVHVLPPHLKGTGLCWRLKMSMYGTLLAAGDFQDTFVKCLKEECCLIGGESSPCIYHDPKCDLQAAYHGDDVVAVAYAEDLDKFTEKLGKHFELVVKATLGPEVGDDKKASLLNRLLTWEDSRLLWECDPRQIDLAVAELGLVGSKPRSTPGIKVSLEEREKAVPLPPEAVRAYRGAAARIGYIAHDRFDLLYPAKECLRGMQKPTDVDLRQLKHIGRYLVGKPRVALVFVEQKNLKDPYVTVLADTDYAGCPVTRRSTNGGIVFDNLNPLHAWSTTQTTPAMSSGEAELYGCVKGSAEGLGVVSAMKDLGEKRMLRVGLDSSAALGIVRRVGLGKLKHVDTKYLWVQHARKQGRLSVFKIDGKLNGANLMTKYMGRETLESDMSHCGLVTLDGRHVDALKLEVDLKSVSKGSVLLLLTLSSLPRLALADGVGDLLETDDKTSMALTYFIIGMMVLVFGCWCYWAGAAYGRVRPVSLMKDKSVMTEETMRRVPESIWTTVQSGGLAGIGVYHVDLRCGGLSGAKGFKLWRKCFRPEGRGKVD